MHVLTVNTYAAVTGVYIKWRFEIWDNLVNKADNKNDKWILLQKNHSDIYQCKEMQFEALTTILINLTIVSGYINGRKI